MLPTLQTGVPAISDADFERLRQYFYRRTGIRFTAEKRYYVDKRLQACIAESGAYTFGAWFAQLQLGLRPELSQRLISQLTVNETYFLREDYQFDCLLRSVLPAVLADRSGIGGGYGPVSILSIPCSTGEEPYSIALRLLADWPLMDSVDVSIHAADIDADALATARQGRYGARSLQRVPPAWLERYFARDRDELFAIDAEIRDAIEFTLVNICDPAQMRSFAGFDVIFCRNLLIYFDEMSSRLAADNLYAALRPGGYLFLGHSESMSRISGIFTPRRFPEALVYQRPRIGGV